VSAVGQRAGYVLTGPALAEGQREVLAQALADAITYREPGSPSDCAGCENYPDAALCDDHAADLDLIDAYLALARELGIEVEL